MFHCIYHLIQFSHDVHCPFLYLECKKTWLVIFITMGNGMIDFSVGINTYFYTAFMWVEFRDSTTVLQLSNNLYTTFTIGGCFYNNDNGFSIIR